MSLVLVEVLDFFKEELGFVERYGKGDLVFWVDGVLKMIENFFVVWWLVEVGV